MLRSWRTMAWLAVPFAIGLIAKVLAAFAVIIEPYLAIHYDVRFELGMVIGQVLFQWCVLWRRSWRERLDYGLILITISALGATLLVPLLLWNHAVAVTPLAAVAWFFAVVGVMFAAHAWLVKKARLPLLLCGTWVVYRLLLLLVIVRRP